MACHWLRIVMAERCPDLREEGKTPRQQSALSYHHLSTIQLPSGGYTSNIQSMLILSTAYLASQITSSLSPAFVIPFRCLTAILSKSLAPHSRNPPLPATRYYRGSCPLDMASAHGFYSARSLPAQQK